MLITSLSRLFSFRSIFAVENEVADNMYQWSEPDYLICNAPLAYADLILNGDPEGYLKTVTEYKPLDINENAANGEHKLAAGGVI